MIYNDLVYGGLPPLVRLEQARLFNSPDNPYDILLATDAIGHGLNLNIRRIIFYTMSKFDGTTIRDLEDNEIRQIAGRAGRYGSIYPDGIVTTFTKNDLTLLKSAMSSRDIPPLEIAGLFPTSVQLEHLAHKMKGASLPEILVSAASSNRMDELQYFFCNVEDAIEIAKMMHTVEGLTIRDRIDLLMTPVQTDEPLAMNTFYVYVKSIAAGVPTSHLMLLPQQLPRSLGQLQELESIYKVLEMYCWLSYRYEDIFDDREDAKEVQQQCRELIEQGLSISGTAPKRERRKREERRTRIKRRRMHVLDDLRRFGIDEDEYSD
jgi:ATP-dependent RNA helicase SUPV3L1/SUV3